MGYHLALGTHPPARQKSPLSSTLRKRPLSPLFAICFGSQHRILILLWRILLQTILLQGIQPCLHACGDGVCEWRRQCRVVVGGRDEDEAQMAYPLPLTLACRRRHEPERSRWKVAPRAAKRKGDEHGSVDVEGQLCVQWQVRCRTPLI